MNVEDLKLIYVHREILRDNVKEKRQEIKDIKKQIKEINSLFRVIKHFLEIKPVKSRRRERMRRCVECGKRLWFRQKDICFDCEMVETRMYIDDKNPSDIV